MKWVAGERTGFYSLTIFDLRDRHTYIYIYIKCQEKKAVFPPANLQHLLISILSHLISSPQPCFPKRPSGLIILPQFKEAHGVVFHGHVEKEPPSKTPQIWCSQHPSWRPKTIRHGKSSGFSKSLPSCEPEPLESFPHPKNTSKHAGSTDERDFFTFGSKQPFLNQMEMRGNLMSAIHVELFFFFRCFCYLVSIIWHPWYYDRCGSEDQLQTRRSAVEGEKRVTGNKYCICRPGCLGFLLGDTDTCLRSFGRKLYINSSAALTKSLTASTPYSVYFNVQNSAAPSLDTWTLQTTQGTNSTSLASSTHHCTTPSINIEYKE